MLFRILGAWITCIQLLIVVRSCRDFVISCPSAEEAQPHLKSSHGKTTLSSSYFSRLPKVLSFLYLSHHYEEEVSSSITYHIVKMVLLGGLEIVAAGYLIHKHQQNKKDKQRLEEEAAALEESQYRIFPPDRPASSSQHDRRRRRSHSRERHDRRDRHDRPHSVDGKYGRESSGPRRDSARPPKPQYMNAPIPQPTTVYHAQIPVSVPPPPPPPQQQSTMRPPPPPSYNSVPTATTAPPQDMKYGWTDDNDPQRPPQQDANFPPTGWPAHWAQSQTPTPQPQNQGRRGESSQGRHERRSRTSGANPSRVRFAESGSERDSSRSPPPSYRA
jgi:hypothetical protein